MKGPPSDFYPIFTYRRELAIPNLTWVSLTSNYQMLKDGNLTTFAISEIIVKRFSVFQEKKPMWRNLIVYFLQTQPVADFEMTPTYGN